LSSASNREVVAARDFVLRPASGVPGSRRTRQFASLPADRMAENITYDFVFDDGLTYHFEVPLHGWVETAANRDEPRPVWTQLAVNQCPNCPLDRSTHRFCPAAVDLHAAAAKFSAIVSHQRARVTVVVGGRTYMAECDMNTGVRSLFGLSMALSGCPIAGRMRPMALRHLPFASLEETLTRVVSHYLLKQYFVMKSGGTPDWEMKDLLKLYAALDAVNSAFVKRLHHASERDSNLNAIVGFSAISQGYTMALDALLEEDKTVFLEGF
jgi:hypothetical protein